MKYYLAAAAAVLGILSSQALVVSGPSLNDQAKKITPQTNVTQDKAKIPTPVVGPVEKVRPLLSIEQFTARRNFGIVVGAYMQNHNLAAVSGAVYALERWDGKTWIKLKTGTLNVKGRASAFVGLQLPESNSAVHFRFTLSQSVEGSVRASVPQRLFVVQYRAPDWNIHAYWSESGFYQPTGSQYTLAQKRAAQLQALGFQTSLTKKEGDYVFSRSLTVVLSFRAVNWQERTFNNREAAQAFEKSLHGMIVKKIGSNAVPWKPIETNIIER